MSKDIFFLGSGFSKAIDDTYPTLKGLTESILGVKYEKESVKNHYYEVSEPIKDNIENLLTYLINELPWKSEVQKSADKALYLDITNKIASYFKSKKTNIDIALSNQYTKDFIDFIHKNKCTCITLNYDTLLEDLLYDVSDESYKTGNPNYKVFYKFAINSVADREPLGYGLVDFDTDFERTKMPSIIKLHGSVNWLYSGVSINDPLYCLQGNESQYLYQDLVPFIVPPTLDKTNSYNHAVLKSLWKNAYDEMLHADNIFIYGFSFPMSDLSIKYLFQSVLSNNSKARFFAINTQKSMNSKSTEYIEKKYKEIFGSRINFDFCCDNSLETFVNFKINKVYS